MGSCPMRPERRIARAALAVAEREAKKNPDGPAAVQLVDERRRDYRMTAAEDYIQELVDDAPELTAEQRDRLAVILRSGRTPQEAA
jgi:hypothetical protein